MRVLYESLYSPYSVRVYVVGTSIDVPMPVVQHTVSSYMKNSSIVGGSLRLTRLLFMGV